MIETITSHLHMSTIITLNTLQLKKYSIVFLLKRISPPSYHLKPIKMFVKKEKNRRIQLQRF